MVTAPHVHKMTNLGGERRSIRGAPERPDGTHEERVIEAFLRREVLPWAPDAWYDERSVKVGYEISFNRVFYKPKPMRTLEEITADILATERESEGLLEQITAGLVAREPRERP